MSLSRSRASVAKRFQNFFSRSSARVRNNLGIVSGEGRNGVRLVRNKELDVYDAYYESTQYGRMPQWDESNRADGEFIPVRERQPRIIYNFGKVMVDRITSKLVGQAHFPDLKVEEDPDTDKFIDLIIQTSKFKQRAAKAIRLMCLSGSSFMRFNLIEGSLVMETYHSKFCYPTFKENGKLQAVTIKYVYEDQQDKDESGNYRKKWMRLDLGEETDIYYDNPPFNFEAEPVFKQVGANTHTLGFVQGHWFRTDEDKHTPDGPSIIGEVLDFIDELNYNLSQSSQAISYNQEPQLSIKGLDVDGIENLIRSSSKTWNLGRDGEAKFIETSMEGVKTAGDFRDKCRLGIQDVARVVLLDPDKMTAAAQSGKAMEVLHGPMVELINELRPSVEEGLIELATRMAIAVLVYRDRGLDTDIQVPDGYVPLSLTLMAAWPQIFPMTMEDLQKKAQVAQTLVSSNVYSREWATGWLAKDVGVENVEEELQKIAEQAPLDPFGSLDMMNSFREDPAQGSQPPAKDEGK